MDLLQAAINEMIEGAWRIFLNENNFAIDYVQRVYTAN
jgi:hypothetical protein